MLSERPTKRMRVDLSADCAIAILRVTDTFTGITADIETDKDLLREGFSDFIAKMENF